MIYKSVPLLNNNDERQRDLKQIVTIFGFSYKKNTSDSRTTPAAFMVNYLASKGIDVRIHDPQVSEMGFLLEMEA